MTVTYDHEGFAHFTIPGEPVPWQRTGNNATGGTVRHYTPGKTAAYQKLTATLGKIAMKGQAPFTGAVSMTVTAFRTIPASWSKVKRKDALEGRILPTARPDADNYAKTIMDALNGIAYVDDAQVMPLLADKVYSDDPRAVVTIKPRESK